jgi:hypothetical protein
MKTAGYWDATPCCHINILLPNSATSHPRSRNLQQISLIKNPNSPSNFPKKLKKGTSRNTTHNVFLAVPGIIIILLNQLQMDY